MVVAAVTFTAIVAFDDTASVVAGVVADADAVVTAVAAVNGRNKKNWVILFPTRSLSQY